MPNAVLEAAVTSPAKPKVGFVSLGCPKNLVDSEVMMGMLHHNGAQLTPNAEDAEIIVINTCSFIDSAKQESVNTILEMVKHKTEGRAQRIVVAGCLVERYRDEIQKNIPEVDAVVGTGELEAILSAAGLTAAVQLTLPHPAAGFLPAQHRRPHAARPRPAARRAGQRDLRRPRLAPGRPAPAACSPRRLRRQPALAARGRRPHRPAA